MVITTASHRSQDFWVVVTFVNTATTDTRIEKDTCVKTFVYVTLQHHAQRKESLSVVPAEEHSTVKSVSIITSKKLGNNQRVFVNWCGNV